MLGGLAAATSVVVFWFWRNSIPLIVTGEFKNYPDLLIPLVGLLAAGVLFSLAVLFIKNSWMAYASTIISLGTPYFFVPATNITIGAFILSAALAAMAVRRVRREFTLSVGFSLSKIIKNGLPLYFSIGSLLVAVFYLHDLRTKDVNVVETVLPKSALTFTLDKLSGPLQNFSGLPTIKPDERVDDLIKSLVEEQLKNQGIKIPQISSKEIGTLIAKMRTELSQNYNLKLSGKEKVTDVFYNTISERLLDLLGPYSKYLPLASALAFLFAFKTLTIPLYYLTLLITFLLIKILLAAKILKVEKTQLEVEKITL